MGVFDSRRMRKERGGGGGGDRSSNKVLFFLFIYRHKSKLSSIEQKIVLLQYDVILKIRTLTMFFNQEIANVQEH